MSALLIKLNLCPIFNNLKINKNEQHRKRGKEVPVRTYAKRNHQKVGQLLLQRRNAYKIHPYVS